MQYISECLNRMYLLYDTARRVSRKLSFSLWFPVANSSHFAGKDAVPPTGIDWNFGVSGTLRPGCNLAPTPRICWFQGWAGGI